MVTQSKIPVSTLHLENQGGESVDVAVKGIELCGESLKECADIGFAKLSHYFKKLMDNVKMELSNDLVISMFLICMLLYTIYMWVLCLASDSKKKGVTEGDQDLKEVKVKDDDKKKEAKAMEKEKEANA